MTRTGRRLFFLLIVFLPCAALGQEPFLCEGQAFVIQQGTGELAEMVINPGNNSLNFPPLNPALGLQIEALGFRSADRLLYGISRDDHRLYRIDANGAVEGLGLLGLDDNLAVIGGAVSPDGRYFAAIGAGPGMQIMFKVDLESPGYAVTPISLDASRMIIDLAFNPIDGKLYGYDQSNRALAEINFNSGAITAFSTTEDGNEIQGLYFNPFGELLAYGTSAFGVAGSLFKINKSDGRETRYAAGPVHNVTDIAACPYSVAIRNGVSPATTFPCSEARYTYIIGNGSGQVQSGAVLEHQLPAGFELVGVVRNPFGGTLAAGGPPNRARIEDMSIPRRVDSLVILVEVGDITGGNYPSQALLSGLPEGMGGSRPADNPATLKPNDSTAVLVNRFEEDSLSFSSFLCLGQSLDLDGSDYGNDLLWSNGSTDARLSVTQQGVYTLQAFSGCQNLSVTYEVTAASCPFTIEVGHKILPAETFPCQEVTFRYIIDNDSGLPRSGLELSDTLPPGFSALRLGNNPFGGTLRLGLPPELLCIRNMTLPEGIDSLDVIVQVGAALPGTYRQRATLSGLPVAMGPRRLSFNADTISNDSTALHVFGVDSDSTYLERTLCPGETLVLDGSPYGTSFLWEGGSAGARLPVTQTGRYQLAVFNGCEPSLVFFDVAEGPLIDIEFPVDTVEIHLGEEYRLSPALTNLGSAPLLEWEGPLVSYLSCTGCLSPIAKPLENARYAFRASNELCADTLYITFLIDDTRRIYAPTAFSPNQDGRNDYFYLQSPDFGAILDLSVYDRWGGLVFQSSETVMNLPQSGWDGQRNGKPVPEGAYLWSAKIEFIGQIVEVFSGEVAVLR